MARRLGLVSGLVLVVGIALFVPVFSEAALNIQYGGWQYADETNLILSNIPVVLAAGIMLLLVIVIEAQWE